jgi:uncharacterized membrane protein (DUF2068 family)
LLTTINVLIITLLVINIIGLVRLRRWAWLFTMILTGAGLLIGIVQYFHGVTRYFNLVTGVLIVFYLNQRSVQQRFKRRGDAAQKGVA